MHYLFARTTRLQANARRHYRFRRSTRHGSVPMMSPPPDAAYVASWFPTALLDIFPHRTLLNNAIEVASTVTFTFDLRAGPNKFSASCKQRIIPPKPKYVKKNFSTIGIAVKNPTIMAMKCWSTGKENQKEPGDDWHKFFYEPTPSAGLSLSECGCIH